jgi:hypothetical protein
LAMVEIPKSTRCRAASASRWGSIDPGPSPIQFEFSQLALNMGLQNILLPECY